MEWRELLVLPTTATAAGSVECWAGIFCMESSYGEQGRSCSSYIHLHLVVVAVVIILSVAQFWEGSWVGIDQTFDQTFEMTTRS